MLPAGDDVAMLDNAEDAVEVLEGKVTQVYQNGKWVKPSEVHKVAAKKAPDESAAYYSNPLRKNAMGAIDGSRDEWKPFVDKAPKEALNTKRTFLPKTAKAFRLNNMKKIYEKGKWKASPEEKRIEESLKKAEDPNRETKVEKMMHQSELRESKDVKSNELGFVAGEKKPQWPLKATKRKSKSFDARWPFGKPTIELLQDSESDSEDQDEQHIEKLNDPVQDMLAANGWTADMLKHNGRQVHNRDDDERQGQSDNDDDQRHKMLGESSEVGPSTSHADNDYQGELPETHMQQEHDDKYEEKHEEKQEENQDLGESAAIDQHDTAPKKKKTPTYKVVSNPEPVEDEDENEDIDIINGDPEGTDDP